MIGRLQRSQSQASSQILLLERALLELLIDEVVEWMDRRTDGAAKTTSHQQRFKQSARNAGREVNDRAADGISGRALAL